MVDTSIACHLRSNTCSANDRVCGICLTGYDPFNVAMPRKILLQLCSVSIGLTDRVDKDFGDVNARIQYALNKMNCGIAALLVQIMGYTAQHAG